MKTKIYYCLLLFLILTQLLHAAADETKSGALAFTIITLHKKNIPPDVINVISAGIRDTLIKEGYKTDMDSTGSGGNPDYHNCITGECVSEIRERLPMRFLILITVTAEEIKTGQRKFTKYLVEEIFETKYSIRVITIDPHKEKSDLNIKSSPLDPHKINIESKNIGLKIAVFYKDTKPVYNDSMQGNNSDYFIVNGMSFNFSYLYVSGNFREIAEYGYGINTCFSGYFNLFKNLSLNAELGVYKLSPSADTIESAYAFLPEITSGYTFHPAKNISIGPTAGIGYSIIFIDGAESCEPENRDVNIYYNPEFNAGIETIFHFLENYSFVLSTSYGYIAEKDILKPFGTLNFGLRMNL